jgi:O-antigen ligase
MLVDIQNRYRYHLLYALAIIFGGAFIASIVTLLLLEASTVWIFLIFVGLLALLPMFVAKDIHLYWLTLFLFSLTFDIKKNLGDGFEIARRLKIDYLQPILLIELHLSDLSLLILIGLWFLSLATRQGKLFFPKLSYLALGYIGWAILSSFKAPIIYLSFVQLIRECKFFFIYLYVVNNIRSQRALKIMGAVLLVALALQGVITISRYRFKFGSIGGSAFGRSGVDLEKSGSLKINSSTGGSLGMAGGRRGFGTMPGPPSTAKHLVLVLPLAFLSLLSSSSWRKRGGFLLLFALGVGALGVTFSRAGLMAFLGETVLCLWFGYRRGLVSKQVLLFLCFSVVSLSLLSIPLVYSYMHTRPEAVSARWAQYDVAINMIVSNPILGVGLNNSTGVQKSYSNFSSSTLSRDPTKFYYKEPINAHYLALASEVGIVGLVLYMGFFILVCREALSLSRSSDCDMALFFSFLLISMIGLFIHLTVDPLNEDPICTLLWIYAGVIVSFSLKEQNPGIPAALTTSQSTRGQGLNR